MVMNLTSSSHLGIPNRFRCQQMPLLFHKDGCLLVVRTTKLFQNWGRRFLHPRWWGCVEVSSVHFPNSFYCTPTGLYYTCNFQGQLICVNYSTRTTNVRVTQLESIPLGRLPPHYRDSYTLFRITKNYSVTELHGL